MSAKKTKFSLSRKSHVSLCACCVHWEGAGAWSVAFPQFGNEGCSSVCASVCVSFPLLPRVIALQDSQLFRVFFLTLYPTHIRKQRGPAAPA